LLKKAGEAESNIPLSAHDISPQASTHSLEITKMTSSEAPPTSFFLQSGREETSTELTAQNILDIIMKRIDQDAEQNTDLDPLCSKSAAERRLDLLRSTETIRFLSPELVYMVRCFMMVNRTTFSVLQTAAYSVNTHLSLLKAQGGGRLELARQAFSELVYIFIWKCVTQLLLEFFLLPHHYHKPEGIILAAAESSESSVQKSVSPSEISDVCGGRSSQLAWQPSSEVSSNSIGLLAALMVKEVMKILPVKVEGFCQGETIKLS
ncbi:hypothetical protein GN956_G18370, partial [Arapaima gigas]